MIKRIIILLIIASLVISCATTVTLTGERREPLPEDAEVSVYNIKPPENYEEIGYMVLRGSLEYRIEEAKKIAREYGCNGIIAKEEEKKERTRQEPVYRTVHETDSITGLPSTRQELVRYETIHEEWIEQLFFIIYIN